MFVKPIPSFSFRVLLVAMLIGQLLLSSSAHTASVPSPHQVIIPAPPQLAATSFILMDAYSGRVLAGHDMDNQLPPASITKLMTSYIVSAEIARGAINLSDPVAISVKAWKKGGSKMFVREGTTVSVEDLMKGMIIQSGNDATIALAEHIAGSEEAFVDIMNQQAAFLGLMNTQFRNATGWPHKEHYSSARDIAELSRVLITTFPSTYKTYSQQYFSYNGINQANRNKLLFRYKSVDGLKTGHTSEAGYCLAASAQKDGMRLISVVMGTVSADARAVESQKLLSYGFRYYKTHKLYDADAEVSQVRLWKGASKRLSLGVDRDVYVTIPKGMEDRLLATAQVHNVIEAPVKLGQPLGSIHITLDYEEIIQVPLLAQQAVQPAGLFRRLMDAVSLFFIDLFS